MIPLVGPEDAQLVHHTHPRDWPTPTCADRYNLVVIGGGPAGLVAAFGAAGLGARVAVVERGLLGGDCLVSGCVPSKALLRSAHAAQAARDAASLGVHTTVDVDFAQAMARLRRIRADIAPHDSATRLRDAGVDVYFGSARFMDAERVGVDGAGGTVTLRFVRAMIATGARAAIPPIPGLNAVGALTNEELFSLTTRPEHLVVLGAGVIGCEMAQAFARLGSAVTVVDVATRVLPREDAVASTLVAEQLRRDGVRLHLGVKVAEARRQDGRIFLRLDDGTEVTGDQLLVATGRTPNLELDLDKAGVAFTARGVTVDDTLRTTNPRVYAAGDVIGQAQFTHAADHHARLVLRNALFPGPAARVTKLVIPRVTFTHPEVAAVGLPAEEAEKDPSLRSYSIAVGDTDRARTDGEMEGHARVTVDGRGRIRGATIVAEQAGELLAPFTLAMTHGLTMAQLASTIVPYPTRNEVVSKLASQWNKERLTPTVARLFHRWMAVRRR